MHAHPDHYYTITSLAEVAAGDLWQGLPMPAPFRTATIALLVTPKCDLAQRKTPSVTYVPVVPIVDFMTSEAFARELLAQLRSRLQGVVTLPLPSLTADREEVQAAIGVTTEALERVKPKSGNASRKTDAWNQAVAATRALARAVENRITDSSAQRDDLLAAYSPNGWKQLCTGLICNGHRDDTYFLPADERVAIGVGSVALFRYPMTVPYSVLFSALQDTAERPELFKLGALRDEFFADLATRFTGFFARIGKRDFAPETVAELAARI